MIRAGGAVRIEFRRFLTAARTRRFRPGGGDGWGRGTRTRPTGSTGDGRIRPTGRPTIARRIDRGTAGRNVSEEGETVHPRSYLRELSLARGGSSAGIPRAPRVRADRTAAASPGSLEATYRSGRWGCTFTHGSLAGRTIGVELVASPCQRLRGCRHLQPSTGLSADERRPPVEMPARTRDPRWRVEFRISNAARRAAIDRRERARRRQPTDSMQKVAAPMEIDLLWLNEVFFQSLSALRSLSQTKGSCTECEELNGCFFVSIHLIYEHWNYNLLCKIIVYYFQAQRIKQFFNEFHLL